MVLAQGGWPDGRTGFICLAVLLLSAAGSAILNSVLDAPIDRRMARLEKRVAAMETAGSNRAAIMALTGIALALYISFHIMGRLVFLLVLTAVLSYTLLYTLGFKRRSPWGVVPGGIPGALPVLIGYATVASTIRLDALLLFIFMLLWQPPHFWALAMGFSEDYRRGGIPVLPVARGRRFTAILILIYATALIPASLSLWLFGFCSAYYAVFALVCGVAFLGTCFRLMTGTGQSASVFSSSIIYLILIFASIVADQCIIKGPMP